MLKLRKLSFNGIGRFTSLQTIDFTSKTNLIQVNGKNNNTGGSSGSAKSTVFHAMDYLLGINDIPSTALQSRKQKDTLFASCLFDKDGAIYKVERSKKKGLCLFIVNGTTEDPIATGSTKVAEEELDKMLGLPRELVSKLVHKRQSDGGFFLNLKPKEVYEFLAKCLDLQHFNQKILELNEKSKGCESLLVSILNEKQGLESSLNSISQIKKEFKGPPEPDISVPTSSLVLEKESLVYDLEQKIIQYNQKMAILSENQPKGDFWEPDKTELIEKKKKLEELKSKYYTELAQFNQQKMAILKKQAELQKELDSTVLLEKEKKTAIFEIKKISEDVKSLKSCTCPTCLQSWIGEEAQRQACFKQDEINTKIQRVRDIDEKLSTIEEQKAVINRLNTILEQTTMFPAESDYKVTMALIEGEILAIEKDNQQKISSFSEKQQKEFNDYNRAVNSCKYEHEQETTPIKEKIGKIEWEIKTNELKTKTYQESLGFYEKEIKNIEKQEVEIAEKIKKIETNYIDIEKKRDSYLEASRCVRSYLMNVFQDSLDYIGSKATSMLNKIPHTSGSVIYFETGKQNKDGTIKEEITAYINLESDMNVPVCTLCGGERSAIDLAIDLAVNDLIESRSGKGLDWVVLDEPFNGMDSIGKEASLAVLSESAKERRIIMVDHGSELKELLADCITVVRDGEDSVVL